MEPEAVVCMSCGYNMKANELLKPQTGVDIIEPPPVKPEFVKPGGKPATVAIIGAVVVVAAMVAAGVNMFVDHPLTGVGFGGYQQQLVTNYKRYLPPNFLHPDTASHTAFVTVAAEEGVVGLGLLLAFLVWLGVLAFRARRSVWVQLPMVLIVPIVLYSQFEGRLLEEPYFWLCLALVYAAFRLRGTRPPALSRQPANRDAAVSRLPK